MNIVHSVAKKTYHLKQDGLFIPYPRQWNTEAGVYALLYMPHMLQIFRKTAKYIGYKKQQTLQVNICGRHDLRFS